MRGCTRGKQARGQMAPRRLEGFGTTLLEEPTTINCGDQEPGARRRAQGGSDFAGL